MTIKKQTDIRDCGLVVIQSLHKYFHNQDVEINDLKNEVQFNRDGLNILALKKLAKKYGLEIESYQGNFLSFLNLEIKNPVASIINESGLNHYVIIVRKTKTNIHFLDPISGLRIIHINDFRHIFQDVILTIDKIAFKNKKPIKKINFLYSLKYLKVNSWIFLALFINIFLIFTQSFFIKSIVDYVIPNGVERTLYVLIFLFLLIALMKILFDSIQQYLLKKITIKNFYNIQIAYFAKLRNVSLGNLSKLTNSDYLRRNSLLPGTIDFISSIHFFIFTEIINFIFTGILLIWIDLQLFGIGILIGIIMMSVSLFFQNSIKINYSNIINSTLIQTKDSLDTVFSLKEMKIPSIKRFLEKRYLNSLTKNLGNEYKFWKIDFSKEIIMKFINSVSPLLLTFITTLFVLQNKITIGDMLMFLTIYNFFVTPMMSFSGIISKIPINKKDVSMLNYVLQMKDEIINEENIMMNRIETIELQNLTFSFEDGKNLFQNLNMKIDQNLHIIGDNGSGKSTLLNLLRTTYTTNNSILFNGVSSEQFNLDSIRERIFHIYPEFYFSSGSILDFICDGNLKNQEKFLKNFQEFGLGKLFTRLKINLQQQIENNASNFSSGQRQCILLMKLFVKNFDFIFLDEAFENIEKQNVFLIKQALLRFQKETKFLEISHTQNYITQGKEFNIDEISFN